MKKTDYFGECKTLDEAKQLYRKLCIRLHPDRSGYDSKTDFQQMLAQFEKFRPATERFTGEFDNWNATEYAHLIEQLLQIPGIKIEICGSWIWLSGDTKPVKDQIKAVDPGESMRRGWSKHKMKWYFSPRGYRKRSGDTLDFDTIKDLYGHRTVRKDEKKQRALKKA